MVTVIKWSSLHKSVRKFMPKKFYEIDSRMERLARDKLSS